MRFFSVCCIVRQIKMVWSLRKVIPYLSSASLTIQCIIHVCSTEQEDICAKLIYWVRSLFKSLIQVWAIVLVILALANTTNYIHLLSMSNKPALSVSLPHPTNNCNLSPTSQWSTGDSNMPKDEVFISFGDWTLRVFISEDRDWIRAATANVWLAQTQR